MKTTSGGGASSAAPVRHASGDPEADRAADADPAEPDTPENGLRPAAGGGRPGRVWALPRGPACAAHARHVLGEALAELGVPRDLAADAQLMVSELATNAYQHAADHGPHELWLYLGEPPTLPDLPWPRPEHPNAPRPATEIRCAVFDGLADSRLPGYSWTSGDCGRGLSIVRELSEGRWGMLRTLSRLGPPTPGKAVWFAVS